MFYINDDLNQLSNDNDFLEEIQDDSSSGGNEGLPISLKVLLYIIYLTISLLAIVGNATVVYLVIAFQRMKTVTNLFIVNLAIGDILMAILCIPFTFISNLLLQYWPFGSVLCSLVSYSQAVSVFVSAYTLVAISIDRYIAIMFPLRPRMSKPQAKIIIIFIWLVALLTPLPTALLSSLVPMPMTNQTSLNLTNDFDVNNNKNNQQSTVNNQNSLNTRVNKLNNQLNKEEEESRKYICQEQWSDMTQRYFYSMTLMILQYFLPLTVLVYTYTKIAYVVFGRPIAANQDQVRAHQSKQKMIKMMIIVCVIYSLCWLPLNTLIVVADLNENIWQYNKIIYIWLVSHVLAMSHCSVNAFIYIAMSNKFRNGFKHIYFPLLACCGCLAGKFNLADRTDCKDFQHSGHYSVQAARRPTTKDHHQNRLKQQNSNNNSNNSNEPVDIVELAYVSDNGAALESDTNNNISNSLDNNLNHNFRMRKFFL